MPSSGSWQRPDPLYVLAEASVNLLATPELSSVLPKILNLASSVIRADAYAVWRTYDGETWKVIASTGLSPEYVSGLLTSRSAPTLTHEPIVINDLRSHPFFRLRGELYKLEGIISMLVVPLLIRSQPEGTITFYWKNANLITPEDVRYAVSLANLAASAINTSELYEGRVKEEMRARFLGEASTLLASSLDYEETLKRVARLAVPSIADWCSVRVMQDGELAITAVAHSDPAKLALADEFSRSYSDDLRTDRGMGRVLATGKGEIYPDISDEMLVQSARDERHLALLRQLGMTSALIVPMKARGRTLGAITLIAAESKRHFTYSDLALADDLARRAAIAVDNAQLHRALEESEAQFRRLVEQSPVSTVIFDSEGHPLESNPAFEKLFGATLRDAPDGYSLFNDPQLHASGVISELERAFRGEQVTLPATRYDTTLTSVNGKGNAFWAEAVLYPIKDGSGSLGRVVMLHTDVSEKIAAEEKRLATESALRRTEKLAAAGRLAATVAHEINNPLEAVTNILFLLRSDSRIPGDLDEYLDMADEELRRVAHIAQQTLGFYRESVAPESVDVSVLVADILSLYKKRLSGKSITLKTELRNSSNAVVFVGEIKQVVSNLLTNAIDACADGGSIAVRVSSVNGHVRIVVADDGSGIDQAILPHIFEPFFTTKKDVGTGLGLWVSKGIVDRHRGSIEVKSRSDGFLGTQFVVLVPSSS